jgi:hypothetical protein
MCGRFNRIRQQMKYTVCPAYDTGGRQSFDRAGAGWLSTMALKATVGTPSERPVLVTVADEMPEQPPPLLPGDD